MDGLKVSLNVNSISSGAPKCPLGGKSLKARVRELQSHLGTNLALRPSGPSQLSTDTAVSGVP